MFSHVSRYRRKNSIRSTENFIKLSTFTKRRFSCGSFITKENTIFCVILIFYPFISFKLSKTVSSTSVKGPESLQREPQKIVLAQKDKLIDLALTNNGKRKFSCEKKKKTSVLNFARFFCRNFQSAVEAG